MNHPHLYIKSLLEEVKLINEKMTKLHLNIQRNQYLPGGTIFSAEIQNDYKKIESMSLEIEQLNQEIINTLSSMEYKQ